MASVQQPPPRDDMTTASERVELMLDAAAEALVADVDLLVQAEENWGKLSSADQEWISAFWYRQNWGISQRGCSLAYYLAHYFDR